MRVLIVTQHFWPESFRINDVAQALVASGWDVSVLTGKPNYPNGRVFDGYRALGTCDEHWNAIRIIRVPLFPRGRGTAAELLLNYLSYIASATILAPVLAQDAQFDVILVYGTSPIFQAVPALVLGKLRSKPVVLWVQDLWPDSLRAAGYIDNRMILRVVGAGVRLIYRSCSRLLVQSFGFADAITGMAPKVPLAVLPNPAADAPSVTAAAYHQRSVPLADGFNVVFAGNLGAVQGLDSLLNAAELLRENRRIHIHLVGDGSRSTFLRAQIATRNLSNVHMPGRFPPQLMPDLFARADALFIGLNPDPAMALTIPSKLQSYLAAGRPIIAAIQGETADLIRDNDAGVVVPPGDASALAQAILALQATDVATRERLGANALLLHQQRFSLTVVSAELRSQLTDTVRTHGVSRY